MKLLMAEDEQSLSEALTVILTRNGYQVEAVFDGESAIARMGAECFDAAILDIMMPKVDGLKVLKWLRANGDLTPVLILTAKSQVENRVAGLDAGANDYLTKPFHSKELIARIRAMTRAQDFQKHPKLCFGNVTIDRENFGIETPTGSLCLSNKEFQMIEMLMGSQNRQITGKRFMEKLWGQDEQTDGELVRIYISYLQKKLASLHADFRIEEIYPSVFGMVSDTSAKITVGKQDLK